MREALLELQILREREARVLEETRTLLECVEAYSTAPSAGAALASIFVSLAQKIGADLSMLVVPDEAGSLRVVACSEAAYLGETLRAPVDVFARPRNIADLNLLGEWSGAIDPETFPGLIVAPVSDSLALMALRKAPHPFRKTDVPLVQRLSGLAAQALQNREVAAEKDLLAATISGSSSGFAIADATDPNRPLVYVNAAFERISGYSAAESLGRNCRFLNAEPEGAPERVRLGRAVAEATGGTFLLRNRRKSGELFWNELTLFPVRDTAGTVRNLVATQSDVSDRVAAAAERDQANDRMRRALAATEDAFLLLDRDQRVVFANDAVEGLFPADGLQWARGTHFSQNWARYLEGCRDLPGRVTALLRNPDIPALSHLPSGREVDLPDGRNVLMRAGVLDDGGLVVSATDITAMKSAERLLSQRLAAIEATSDGIAVTDDGGRLIYLNSSASYLLGFAEARSGLGQRWRDRYAPGPERTRPGAPFATTLSRASGETVQTHEISGAPLDGGGSVIVIRDITENLATAAREEDLMAELLRMQRQEAIAQLTAGVAHDFNNLLSAINGSATLIGMIDDLPAEVKPHLERIATAGAQSAKLVARLLDIGAGSETTGTFALSSILADLPSLVAPSLPGRIAFAIEDGTPPVALRGTASSLSQILINLILNARDAIGAADGRIALSVTRFAATQAKDLAVGSLDPGRTYARLAVQDTGAGMDAETASDIFRPYFTTKGRQGTGLGLATAAMQIRSVGGALGVQTAPGAGTRLTVYWPIAELRPRTEAATLAADDDLTGLTILVVDDDPNVGAVLASFLEARGAEVAGCEDPRDALAVIEEDPAAWSALITDYDMPAMSGGALAAAAIAAAPDLPVFVVTALSKRLSDPRLMDGKAAGIFAKPIDLEALAQALAAQAVKR
ncbi:hypothetical protein roselon_01227 [Roseibacterium elongatum DSM 19469]|uniref:histidine kinase n=1 Tax=Roseicyclus elongatus DSM 19469 TaxID=1294273 RepID=W8RRA8_9RHOB|nr:hypothetical protein roselon_01227 [Roseibacterium elongatum DSM 19469]